MRSIVLTFILTLSLFIAHSQEIAPGRYESGLRLAYDRQTQMLTGYYDDTYPDSLSESGDPNVAGTFYIQGKAEGSSFPIAFYFPGEKNSRIVGSLRVGVNNEVYIRLSEEYGSLPNFQRFATEPAMFRLEERRNWSEIRYVNAANTGLYKDKNAKKPMVSIAKNRVVFVEKVDEEYALCSFYGKKPYKGWIRLTNLNTPEPAR
ncbi:MAG: hypothetical protein V4616_10195 [Bacteroidota bacterium]